MTARAFFRYDTIDFKAACSIVSQFSVSARGRAKGWFRHINAVEWQQTADTRYSRIQIRALIHATRTHAPACARARVRLHARVYPYEAIERRMIQFVRPMSLSGATPCRAVRRARARIGFDLTLRVLPRITH